MEIPSKGFAPHCSQEHPSTTTDEVVARLTKNWEADVRAFDAVYEHILMMSDALAEAVSEPVQRSFDDETLVTERCSGGCASASAGIGCDAVAGAWSTRSVSRRRMRRRRAVSI